MADAGRWARFAQETKPRRFVTEIFFANDFQCHGASKIHVERFKGDPIAPRPNSTISAYDKLIMLKPFHSQTNP